MDYSSIANLPNLGPGSTGSDVLTLQKWLVANGFMTQDQLNTGPGTYGPKTTAAVAAWQQKSGFDTQGNPGYFGPLSKTYISTQVNAPQTTTTAPTQPTQTTQPTQPTQPTTSTTQTTQSSLSYDPTWAKYGLTQDQWNQMSPVQQATVGAALNVAKNTYSTNASTITLQQALASAATDPNLVAKYADAAKMDAQSFAQNLQQIQQASSTTAQQQAQQFETDRKDLAEKSAAAGQAYSGFRGQAQANLAKTESGIVQSSRSSLQNSLNNATSAFESKYGTAATTPATAQYTNPYAGNISLSGQYAPTTSTPTTLSGQLAGGITGTSAINKQADTQTLASQYVNAGQTPAITSSV